MGNTQNKPAQKHTLNIKKGDTVLVISGKDRGNKSTVKKVLAEKNKVLVDGLNMVKKAVKPNPALGMQGGLIPQEAAIAASNVMLYCLKCNKPTRIRFNSVTKGDSKQTKRVRVCAHCNEQLDA